MSYTFEPLLLSQKERNDYYLGFSNKTLWPLFHDFPECCRMDSSHWDTYQAVNRRFAQTVARISNADDYIWVQDYHLLLLARNLRGVGAEHRTGFFLHTSFLSPDVFGRLPWRAQVIKAMLDYDLVGFQAHRDRDNSMQCVEHCTERSARDLHYEKAGRLNLPGSKASVVEGLL